MRSLWAATPGIRFGFALDDDCRRRWLGWAARSENTPAIVYELFAHKGRTPPSSRLTAIARRANNSRLRSRCDSAPASQTCRMVVIASGLMSIRRPHAAWNRSTISTSSSISASTRTDAAPVTHRSPDRAHPNVAPSRQSCDQQRRDRGGHHRRPHAVTKAGRNAEFGQSGVDQQTEPLIDPVHRHAESGVSGDHCDLHGARTDRKGSATRYAHQHRPAHLRQSAVARSKLGQRVWPRANDQGWCDRQMKIVGPRMPSPISSAKSCSR